MAYEPFVEGWDFVETLGEGAYGEVRLAVNRKTQEAVAVKIVNGDKLAGNKDSLKKEVCIHKMLNDIHIIRYYGQRTENNNLYLFLEYAPGGELFDKIEPDVGMPIAQANKYFKQLLSGMEFIHSKGVTHRDIKPENLLLDADGNLKITDFGLSTVYKYKEKERMLDRCCGTPPYVAPEVLSKKEYRAEPADIWSCGIVLVAMLAGELPWDEPSEKCHEYIEWTQSKFRVTPWTKIDTLSLALLKKILHPSPSKRYTIAQIKTDKWYLRSWSTLKSKSPRSGSGCSPMDSQPFKRHCSNHDTTPKSTRHSSRLSMSQPDPVLRFDSLGSDGEKDNEKDEGSAAFCFSQPTNIEDLLLSQISATPGSSSSQNPLKHLVKRMTRFNVTLSIEEVTKKLSDILHELGFQCKICNQKQIRITSIDRRKTTLTYLVNLVEISGLPLLVDFRLSKGDGICFKRQFRLIKDKFSSFLV